MVNRTAVILRYKEPFVRWINEADPDDDSPDITVEANEQNVYLIHQIEYAQNARCVSFPMGGAGCLCRLFPRARSCLRRCTEINALPVLEPRVAAEPVLQSLRRARAVDYSGMRESRSLS